MTKEKVVCRCNMVTVRDVETFVEAYPNMPIDQMRHALNVGTRCGCCKTDNCLVVDENFQTLVKKLSHLNKI